MKASKILIILAVLSALAFQTPAQASHFPNELKGYEFFGKGLLKDLRLGVSTQKDVQDIFGQNCEHFCEYDENWNVAFNFFSANTKLEINEKALIPKEQYFGKLYSVALTPGNDISFRKIKFPKSFGFVGSGGGGACADGVGGCSWSESRHYEDAHGLSYLICEKSFPNKCRKGDLSAIIYSIPNNLEAKFFTKEQ